MWHPLWVSVNFQGVCVTQQICMLKVQASYGPNRPMMCVNYAFCIIFEWYFDHVYFVFCSVYKFHYILESVYWFYSKVVPLAYLPVWCCACYFVRFDLSVNYLLHLVSTLYSLYSQMWVQYLSIITLWQYVLAIKWTDIWHRSDLTELWLRVQITSDGVVKENVCGRNLEVWNTIYKIHICLII